MPTSTQLGFARPTGFAGHQNRIQTLFLRSANQYSGVSSSSRLALDDTRPAEVVPQRSMPGSFAASIVGLYRPASAGVRASRLCQLQE
jgi:hypothetical protein